MRCMVEEGQLDRYAGINDIRRTRGQVWATMDLAATTSIHQFLAGIIVSSLAMIIGSQFGKPTSPEMCDLIERAKGKKIAVSKNVQVASSKHLSTENKAITQFVFNRMAAEA